MMHKEEECCVKLKAIKAIMERAKATAKDIEVLHICDNVIQLSDELLGEMNDKG